MSATSQREKTHCPNGHPYSGVNLYMNSGRRYCRACNLLRVRKHRNKRAAA